MIKEQTGIEVIAEVHQQFCLSLFDRQQLTLAILLGVLLSAALTTTLLVDNFFSGNAQRCG